MANKKNKNTSIEALKFAQQIIEENKRLKTDLNSNNSLLVGTAKQNAELA